MTPRVDVEWEAFAAGVKPAVRRTIDPARADEEARRWRSRGIAVALSRAPSPMGGRAVLVLYLARTQAEAEALRDLEEPVLPGSPGYTPGGGEDVVARHRAFGLALGFPPCCVEAFCARLSRGVDVLGPHRGLAEDYVAAREARVPVGDARLDPLLFRARVQVLSFYPCRHDCAAARALADATLAAVAARHGDTAARAIVEALALDLVIAPTGARARVALEGGVVTSAQAPGDDPRDVALAASLVGARARDDGAVEGTGDPPAWWLRFRA